MLSKSSAEDASRTVMESAHQALQELCQSRDARAVTATAELIGDLPLGLQVQTLKYWGDLGDPAALATSLKFLTAAEEPLVRAAVICLGGLGDRRAVRPLLALAVASPQHRIRALDAIVKVGDPAIPTLIEMLESSSEPANTHAVLEVLGRMRNERAIPTMLRYLDDPSLVIRRTVAESLAAIGGAKSTGGLFRCLDDADEVVRMHVLRGIIRSPDPRYVNALTKVLHDPSEDIQLAALEAIGACGDKRSIPCLRPYLEHENDAFVMVAAEALGRLGDADSVDMLIDRLEALGDNSQHQSATTQIIDALRRIGDSRAALPLVNRMQHPAARVRARVAEALGRMGDVGVRPALEDLLRRDSSDEVRAAAAKALGELGKPESIPTLVTIGLAEGPSVRVQALIALGRFKNKSILPDIEHLAGDFTSQVRYQLATILGDLGDPSAITTLVPLAFDHEDIVRRAARRSLEQLGDTRTEKQLRKQLGHRKPIAPSVHGQNSGNQLRKPNRSKRFHPIDLVPSPVFALMALPSSLLAAIRQADAGALQTLPGGKGTVVAAGLLLTGGIYFWTQSLGGPITFLDAPPRGAVAALDASSDGRWLAAGRTLSMIEVWNVEEGRVTDRALKTPSRWLACSSDARHLLAADPSAVVQIKITDSGKVDSTTALRGHKQAITHFTASDDGRYAVTVDDGGTLMRWEIATGKSTTMPLELRPKDKHLRAVALSPDGRQFAAATESGSLTVWDMANGERIAEIAPIRDPVSAIAFTPDGLQLLAAIGNRGCNLHVWNTDSPAAKPKILPSGLMVIERLAFQSGGKLIAAAGARAELWNLEKEEATTLSSEVAMEALVPLSGDQFAVGDDEEPMIFIYDSSGKQQHELDDSPTG
ncbi:MAG: HEAT repeat domain-containing protein [Planctomycetaceae bacterium]|nr:HEAT repeat domain-containing protein [Planctomycetaceae bacterium]